MKRSPLTLFLLPLAITACAAASAPPPPPEQQSYRFTLDDQGGRDEVRARFFREGRRDNFQWSTNLRVAEFNGLDSRALGGPGPNALRFTLNRDSGRLDCAGSGGKGSASGNCRLTSSAAFSALLASAGIASPDQDDWLSLFALDVQRGLIDAVRGAGYPAPTADDLVELAALGVDENYIRALAAAGYRPQKLDTLVELKAVGVTPAMDCGNRPGRTWRPPRQRPRPASRTRGRR